MISTSAFRLHTIASSSVYSSMAELRLLLGNSDSFSLDLAAFRADLGCPALVDRFFCGDPIDNPQLYIGGELVSFGKCVPADDVNASAPREEPGWFEMKFFANRPQLPLHLLAFTGVELHKSSPGNWPIMAYMTGAVLEPTANPSSCFALVQRLDGSYNVILFRFGRAGLPAPKWVQDPKDLEQCVPGFKLSPDLAIA